MRGVQPPVRRYRSPDEDSARWARFSPRAGDIVVSTRSKSGTTWLQMICALLVHRTARLPAPLAVLSPWLDWLAEPHEEVLARLAAQRHRRVVKTHTPLDGLPLHPQVSYVVGVRDPLDMAVSLYHQGANLDRARLRDLTGQPEPAAAPPPRPPLRDWLLAWIAADADPHARLDSLPGWLAHLTDAWSRRERGNVTLVRYEDLAADLDGQTRRLAGRLGVAADSPDWPELVAAATFPRMRARADELAPDRAGVLRDRAAFFRRGRPGAGRELLTPAEYADFRRRLAARLPPDLWRWLDRPPSVGG